MRLVLLTLLLVAPSMVWAAPVAAAIAIWAGVTTATVVMVAQIALTIGMAIYGSAQQKRASKRAAQKARDDFNASIQERTLTGVSADAPYRYVYGRARVGSHVVFMGTSGNKDQYKHLVCVHAAHECDAIEEIYIQGKALGSLDENGFVQGGDYYKVDTLSATQEVVNVTSVALPVSPIASSVRVVGWVLDEAFTEFTGETLFPSTVVGNVVSWTPPANMDPGRTIRVSYTYYQYTPQVRVIKHLGTPTDPADATLISELPGQWNANCVLRGFTYTVVRLDLNQAEFQNGIPSIEVVLRGKKLYDPRTSTTYWNQNPALVIYDYLTSEICGVDAADLNISRLITAANVCDEVIGVGKRYTFNGSVTAIETKAEVLEKMAQAMAGGIVPTSWEIFAGKYVAPVMTLDQSDIVGATAITPGISDADLFNGVRGQYISAETLYVATDFVPFQNPAFVSIDGRELWTDITFPYTDSVQRVHNLCRIFTEDQRNAYTVNATFSLKAWKLKVGDRILLNSAFFGWDNKIFRVTDKKYAPDSGVELTLKEDAASIWDEADQVVPDATPNTNLPNPFAIAPLASMTCQSGTNVLLMLTSGDIISRILVTWPPVTTQAVLDNGLIEVEWQKLEDDVWQRVTVAGSETQAYITGVDDGYFYTVRARTVNPYLNVKSDWVYVTHQVIGKTEPPPNIVDMSIDGSILSWTPVVALDLRGYIFRFHYGNNTDWNSAVPLHNGFVTGSPFDLVARPGGIVTIMGKAVDTSGNESAATANVFTDLGDPFIANVVEAIDFEAEGFPGDISGATITSNGLEANDLDSFYGTDNQSFYGLDSLPFYEPTASAQLVYVTREVQIQSALAGSVMTLDIDTEGNDLFIEYRLVGPGSFYGQDVDSFYGPDAEPFYGGPTAWMPWPGQVLATNDVYQFRVTIGAGAVKGKILAMSLVIDAPDIVEYIADLLIDASGTTIPYTSNFSAIKTVQATLQSNASGAETIEVNKSINLAPVIRAFNSSHIAVSGATADITIKGY